MNESEQLDDLTMTDPSMPPPEKATMSLRDFHAGEGPEFEPIHEEEDTEEHPVGCNCEDCWFAHDQKVVDEFGAPVEEGRIDESAYSFYGIESYLLPKN